MSAYDATRRPWPTLAPEPQPTSEVDGSVPPAGSAPSAPEAAVKASFTGQSKEFFRLCVRAGFFTVITLGLYRFWFLTDVRRLLWRHTRVGGDRFEYRGTGRELLLGFLFALAILAPFYLGYFLLGIEAERYVTYASTPFFLFLVLFGIYASYRGRRYRLTRTVFRGTRFWMTGSGLVYLLRYLGWGLFSLVTVGLAHPWMVASLERYKMGNTFYGDLQGGFVGRGRVFFRRRALLWVLTWLPALVVLVFLIDEQPVARGWLNIPELMISPTEQLIRKIIIRNCYWYLPPWLTFICVMKAIEWRWWVEGLRFGKARLSSTLRIWFLFKEYLKFGLAAAGALLIVGIACGAAYAIGAAVLGPPPSVTIANLDSLLNMQPAAYAVLVPGYLLVSVVLGALYRRFLLFGVWRKVVDSLTLHDGQVFDGVTVKGTPSGAIGEALADALDYGF